jgi:hypothetical protein
MFFAFYPFANGCGTDGDNWIVKLSVEMQQQGKRFVIVLAWICRSGSEHRFVRLHYLTFENLSLN